MTRRYYLPPRPVGRTKYPGKLPAAKIPKWGIVATGAAILTVIILSILYNAPSSPTSAVGRSGQPEDIPAATQPPSDSILHAQSLLQAADSLGASKLLTPPQGLNDMKIAFADPATGKPIQLQILNGCGEKGIAKLVAPAMRAKGFDVRETSNAGSFNYARTLLFDRVGKLENALAVAESLGVEPINVTTQIARNLVDIDVTMIVGADHLNLRMNMPTTSRR